MLPNKDMYRPGWPGQSAACPGAVDSGARCALPRPPEPFSSDMTLRTLNRTRADWRDSSRGRRGDAVQASDRFASGRVGIHLAVAAVVLGLGLSVAAPPLRAEPQ